MCAVTAARVAGALVGAGRGVQRSMWDVLFSRHCSSIKERVIFHVFTDEEKCETLENSGQCDGCNRVLTAVAFQSRF